MALLPNRNIFDGTKTPATTTSDMKTALGSLRDFLAGLLGTDSTNLSAARAALAAAKSGANTDITSLAGVTSINGGALAGMKNLIINGKFAINQRTVSGTVTLTAGAYGHDRWKAGAAGCTYTFATVGTTTTLTISAGSLVQVIEGLSVDQTAYTMGWTGTAQGRILAGSYAVSPIALTAAAGSNLSVEFGTGTLTKVQVEPGAVATVFEQRLYGPELSLCHRYTRPLPTGAIGGGCPGQAYSSTQTICFSSGALMRATPSISSSSSHTVTNSTASTVTVSSVGTITQGSDGSVVIPLNTAGGLVAGNATYAVFANGTYLVSEL